MFSYGYEQVVKLLKKGNHFVKKRRIISSKDDTVNLERRIMVSGDCGSSRSYNYTSAAFYSDAISDCLQHIKMSAEKTTQVELRSLKSKFVSIKNQNKKVTVGDLPPLMVKLKALSAMTEEDVKGILAESYTDMSNEIDFEAFLRGISQFAGPSYYKSGQYKEPFIIS